MSASDVTKLIGVGVVSLLIGVVLGSQMDFAPPPPPPPPAPPFAPPSPGEGKVAQVADDSMGIFRVIPLSVKGCDDPGDTGGTVSNPPLLFMTNEQRVAWVISGRDPDQQWRIRPKASQKAYFGGGVMSVNDPMNDSYFTGKPDTKGACKTHPYCSWDYGVEVLTLQTDAEGKAEWKECAKLDPKIKIRDW